MTTAVSPDIEALVGVYLREHSAVEDLVGDRVGGRHPKDDDTPWVRVTQLWDRSLTPTLHATETSLQLDCYGGSDASFAQEEASELARTVRAALNDMPDAEHDGAVVTRVTFFGPRRVPDPDFVADRERFILDANVTAHPA